MLVIDLQPRLSKLRKREDQKLSMSSQPSQTDCQPAELMDQWFPGDSNEMRQLRSGVQIIELPAGQMVVRLSALALFAAAGALIFDL